MVFLESFSKFLLFLHLLGAFVLAGCLAHNVLIIMQYWRGNFRRRNLEKLHIKICLWAYAVTFGVGALVYPTFRIRVRYEYFDECFPWATGLFEVREHWSAIGFALLLAYYFFRRRFDPEAEREKLFLHTALCYIVNIIVWYCIVVGYYLTTLRSV